MKWLTHGLGYLLIIDHTDVNDQFRGQGLGRKLLNELVTFYAETIHFHPFLKWLLLSLLYKAHVGIVSLRNLSSFFTLLF